MRLRALVLMLMGIVCLGCSGAVAEEGAKTVVQSQYRHPTAPAPTLPAGERAEDAYFRGAVLVGDSLADGLALYGLAPELQLVTSIGLSPRAAATEARFTYNGEEVTLAQKLRKMNPTAVYLWIGTNGLDAAEPDKVLADYGRMLNRVLTALPDVPFFLLEVTPVMRLSNERYAGFTNERIDAFNGGLAELAARHNVYILPTNAPLRNDGGFIAAGYAASDGIHLTRAAHEVIAEVLYTHTLPAVAEAEEGTVPDESILSGAF